MHSSAAILARLLTWGTPVMLIGIALCVFAHPVAKWMTRGDSRLPGCETILKLASIALCLLGALNMLDLI